MLQLTTCWWSFCNETQTNCSKQEFVPILEDRSSVHSSLRFLESLRLEQNDFFQDFEERNSRCRCAFRFWLLFASHNHIHNQEQWNTDLLQWNLDIHWNVGPWNRQNMIALTEFHYMEVLFDLSVTVSAIFNNYSWSPNGLLTQRPWGREE